LVIFRVLTVFFLCSAFSIQSSQALARSEDAYVSNMEKMKLPVSSEDLLRTHQAAQAQAYACLKQGVPARTLKESQATLSTLIETQKDGAPVSGHWFRFWSTNRDLSRAQCQALWVELQAALAARVSAEEFKSAADFSAACKKLESEYEKRAVGPAVTEVAAEGQKHLQDLLARIGQQLKLDEATRKQLQLEAEIHEQNVQSESLKAELTRVSDEAKVHAVEAQKRQQELIEKMEAEKQEHAKELQELAAEQKRQIDRATGEMKKELELQRETLQKQAKEEAAARAKEWDEKIAAERERMAAQQREMDKRVSEVKKKFKVPVYNPATGRTHNVDMSQEDIDALGCNKNQYF
jgi:DNA repair exonuclease SbcCD ATPase subunit